MTADQIALAYHRGELSDEELLDACEASGVLVRFEPDGFGYWVLESLRNPCDGGAPGQGPTA